MLWDAAQRSKLIHPSSWRSDDFVLGAAARRGKLRAPGGSRGQPKPAEGIHGQRDRAFQGGRGGQPGPRWHRLPDEQVQPPGGSAECPHHAGWVGGPAGRMAGTDRVNSAVPRLRIAMP